MLSTVRRFVTATDADSRAERDSLGFVAAGAASVQLVTDENLCGKAKAAFNARQRAGGHPEAASVYVVRAGEGRQVRYVVKGAGLAPDPRSEFDASLVFDRRWRFKIGYGA
jgi:hypothetical protein